MQKKLTSEREDNSIMQQLETSITDNQTMPDLKTQDLILNNDNGSDSFFKKVVGELTNNTNISQKTEYKDTQENFCGTKLEFLAKYGGMPYLSKFVNIFETKRVSLERKGRKELVMVMQEKQQEILRENQNRLKTMFNM